MGVLKIILPLIIFLSLISAACALESYSIDYNIVDNNVVVQKVVNFSKGMTGALSFSIPSDAETIEAYLDGIKTNAEVKNNLVKINMVATKEVRLSYITKEHIDRANFLLNKIIEYDADYFKITLVLPEEAVLKRQIKDETGSIFPKPDKATTDGRSLIFVWEREDVKAGDEISIFVMYKTKEFSLPLPMSILVGIFIIVLVVYFYYSKKHPKKEIKKKIKKKETEHKMLKHLKEDEQQIVRILKQRKGSCEQGTLRVITDFSKARLSRLLAELEERKIIYKEKRGKKNLIFIK